MEIKKSVIFQIENALNVNLYNNQVVYLLGGHLKGGRNSGKTFAHCIKLALSEGEPLRKERAKEFSDQAVDTYEYAAGHYWQEFLRVRSRLMIAGFAVREIIASEYEMLGLRTKSEIITSLKNDVANNDSGNVKGVMLVNVTDMKVLIRELEGLEKLSRKQFDIIWKYESEKFDLMEENGEELKLNGDQS